MRVEWLQFLRADRRPTQVGTRVFDVVGLLTQRNFCRRTHRGFEVSLACRTREPRACATLRAAVCPRGLHARLLPFTASRRRCARVSKRLAWPHRQADLAPVLSMPLSVLHRRSGAHRASLRQCLGELGIGCGSRCLGREMALYRYRTSPRTSLTGCGRFPSDWDGPSS